MFDAPPGVPDSGLPSVGNRPPPPPLKGMPRRAPKSERQYVRNSDALRLAAKLKGAKAGPFPNFVEPALATLRDKPPSSEAWVHEIKFDGYRLQAHLREGKTAFYTRRGFDWTPRFKSLQSAFWDLPADRAVIDGEVVVLTSEGLSDFGALEDALGAGHSDRFTFFAFDLLCLNSWDLRACALIERKRGLEELIGDRRARLRYSEHVEANSKDLYQNACKLQLEGIVSKRKDARYSSGRTANWTKVTCRTRDTFVVVGIAYNRNKFDGIYLARRKEDGLLYAGKVENGFTPASQRDLEERAKALMSRAQPLTKKIRKPKAQWLKPELLVDVEYRALTGEGKVRHPSFKGLREDL
jgi:bifunctional non-homologous end joining protein LigD